MPELAWEAPEFEFHPKGISWYWGSILIAVALVGVAFWQQNFLFGIFVILAEILVLIWGEREPHTIHFKMDEHGLSVGSHAQYRYEEMQNFSFDKYFSEEWPVIKLAFHRHFKPIIKIHLPKNRAEEIRKAFAAKIPEAESEISLMDALEKLLGF